MRSHSGPLDAWYVDTVHATDPAADLRPGLSWGGAACYGGLAAGALAGGATALLATGGGGPTSDRIIWLSVPVLAGAVMWAAHGLAVLRYVEELPRPAQTFSDVVTGSV